MWRNKRDPRIPRSDAWMRESNNAESRLPGLANADYIDERLMNFGVKELSCSPYQGREPPNFSFQANELNRNLWLNRESQSQALSSRKLSRSVNGSNNNVGGFHFERSSTGPRSGPFVNREEDLYSSQEMASIHRNNHRTQTEVRSQQKVPQLEEELYPIMTTMMNYQVAAPLNQGYAAANSFASKKGVDSHRAAFEGAMMNYAPNYSNRQLQNFQYEGSFTGPLDHPVHPFAGPYDHPHARFQEGPYDHPHARFQDHNRQFSGDSYSLQPSSCDGAYNFSKPLHQLTGPPLASQRETSLVSTSNTCTCCKEHTQSHSSFKPQLLTQYPPLGYQHLQAHAHFQDYTTYRKLSSKSSQNSLRSLQLRRKVADPLSQAMQARKENCPPLPGPSAPPYVLCQGCDKVVQIPSQLYFESAVVKVRCGACRRVSKLCNIVHPCYQVLLKEGRATRSLQPANSSASFNKQKLHSIAATTGISEQKSTVQESVSAKLNEEFKSICVVEGQHGKQDKQIEINGTPVGVQNFDAYTPKMLLQQGPGRNEWTDANSFRPWSRSGTFHEDSSSLFSVSGSVSTKNTAGIKSLESQQLETNMDFLSQCTMPEECVQAKEPNVAAGPIYEQQSDSGPIVSSEEIQGLMLECLQESTYDDLKVKKQQQRNQSHQDKQNEPVCLGNNDNNQELASSSPREQILHLKQSDSVRSSSTSYQTFLSPREQTECRNLESGHGEPEVSNDGANSAVSGPAPGSPLYEYLSYDTASEIAEALKCDVEGQQAAGAPYSKGSNFWISFLKKNTHLGYAGQGNNRNVSVVVNGTIIPLDAIKSAEKQAGAIRPGVYWYDYEAGFWGVLGGPCLGIIPPFIAEFKLPLPKDCAGGTTEVFVNGRELHKRDLDVLAGRGLPRTPGKSYMVDISGQVVDSSSGQMLRSLGRLAPTVQKRGRGCGMFQPPTRS